MSSASSTNHQRVLNTQPVYANLLNRLPAAVYVCDPDGYVIFHNEAAVELWGRRPEIGKDLWCGSWRLYDVQGNRIPLDSCPMARTLKLKAPVSGTEIIIEQPSGKRFHILPHPSPIYDENGVMTGAINMLVDVTHQTNFRNLQKHAEKLSRTLEDLKKSEERYHRMVAKVQDYAIILLSKEGIIENWNAGAEKIKGYTEQEVIGQHFRLFYPPEDQLAGLPETLIAEAAEHSKANHEGWRIRKDGSRFWGSISISALHDNDGNVVGFSKVTRDLTERRNQELAIRSVNADLEHNNKLLRQSEERYHRMVSEVEDYVIILLDPEGYIQNWNKGAKKIKGYSADEIIGKHFSIFYSDQDRKDGIPDNLLKAAAKNRKAIHEGWRLRKDGSTFWGSAVVTALHNDEGELIGFTKVTRDLTEKKKAEEKILNASLKLEQKNKELQRINEELSSFAYISSHDLQEPLRKIQTFCDRIIEMEYQNLSEKGKDYFQRMQAGASRMQKLIRDILAYSRATTADKKLEMTNLNDVLAQSKVELEVLIMEKKAVVESERLPTLNVIPFQVHQLFNNLLNNALKFSKKDVVPHIMIRSEMVDANTVPDANPLVSKTYCHLSVSDNGIGFEPEYKNKIFEVFQRLHSRTEYGGTGIGLAICKKIVENHNGFIRAEGVPRQGATFHLYLPVVY
jgi:PAS domain S-box-containing protein